VRELKDKVCVVTGAASGIGLALAEMFVAEGMKAVLADVDARRLKEAEATLDARGADVVSMVCDTSSAAEITELASLALSRFGSAHILCNNAGIAGGGDAWIGPMDEWTRVVDVNLYGVVHGIRAFLPIMTEQGEGHIVNTASMAGLLPMPGYAPYNATKHAVVALSEGLYLELKATASPVEVSVLCPGWVKTRIMEHESLRGTTPMASFMSEVARSAVEHEGIPPEEVAQQVLDAIHRDQFWILTHADWRSRPVERMQRAAEHANPTLLGSSDA
jgi:NAD(P)-dependent dehydrogenase (short-subunit alcohol dehydrogenase family)